MNAFVSLFKLFLTNQGTRTRLFMALLLAIGAIALAFVVKSYSDNDELLESSTVFLILYGANLMVPLVALLLAGSIFGQLLQDETLVYIWLTPTSRLATTLAAITAAALTGVAITAIPLTVASLISSESASLTADTLVASTLGLFAYSALFSLLGLLAKNATFWGLAFIVLWETLLSIVTGPLSVTYYTRSIITQTVIETDPSFDLGWVAAPSSAVISLLIMTTAFAAIAALRLNKMDIA